MARQPSPSGRPDAGSPATTRARTVAPLLCGLISLAGVVLLLTGLATDHSTVQTVGKVAIVLGGLLLLAFSLLPRRAARRRE